MMVDRIFTEGKNANDTDIGSYNDSNEIYVNPRNSPRNFPATGKTGRSIFSGGGNKGKKHTTGYFESYKKFRETVGRKSDKVNLVLFGNLQSDFGKGVINIDEATYASGVSREENSKKIEGFNKKYGPIFRLTPGERTNFKQVLAFEVREAFKNG
jgi:hypothetical protein